MLKTVPFEKSYTIVYFLSQVTAVLTDDIPLTDAGSIRDISRDCNSFETFPTEFVEVKTLKYILGQKFHTD